MILRKPTCSAYPGGQRYNEGKLGASTLPWNYDHNYDHTSRFEVYESVKNAEYAILLEYEMHKR